MSTAVNDQQDNAQPIVNKARLKWACRRGMLELDVLFIPFVDEAYDELTSKEQHIFERLLTEQDPDLFAWFMGTKLVKTVNLMPWCSLFSTASKYNIGVKTSRYKLYFYMGGTLILCLLPLLFFTYTYSISLFIVSAYVFIISVLQGSARPQTLTILSFELSDGGVCCFENNQHYQLQQSSRVSFLGCWLYLRPTTTAIQWRNENIIANKKHVYLSR